MTNDWIADSGYLFLGSRLKRLAEQMQEDVIQVSQQAGIAIPTGKFPLLALLSQQGAQTVGELARALGSSQPVTTRNVSKLIELDLVQVDRSTADGRNRIVSLTPSGERAIARSRETIWPQVEAAVRQVVEGRSGPLLDQIAAIEHALAERSLAERAATIAAGELVPAADADVPEIVALMNLAYRGSSTGWHTEAAYIAGDRTSERLVRADIAANPEASFLTWRDRHDDALKGCVWLEPLGNQLWYLGSLAVDPKRQNAGLGHALLSRAEQWVRARGGNQVRMSVVNVRDALIAWYVKRGYHDTARTSPFPYGDNRFGVPQRDDLCFVILEKGLTGLERVG